MNVVGGFIVCLLTLGLATSCSDNSDDEILRTGDPVKAVFSAKIFAPATRASGTMWDSGDQLGIFMLKDGGSLTTGAAPTGDVLAGNYLYMVNSTGQVADAGSGFLKAVPTEEGGQGAIYMNPGEAYDFVAYYPFKATASLTDGYKYPISLANQYGQGGSAAHDLLYSTSRRKNVRTDDVSFEFNHKLSNITINVTRGKGVDETLFKAKNVVVTGMPTTATFDLSDGATLSDLDAVANIESSKSDADGELYEVIILPQAAAAYPGRVIKFNLSGKDHIWSIPDGFAFEQGKRYTYNFTLTSGGLELNGDVKISAWGDGGALNPTDPGWGQGKEELLQFDLINVTTATFRMGSGTTGNEIEHNVSFTAPGFKMSKYQITTTQYCHYLNGDRDNITVKPNGSNWEAWGKLPAEGLYKETGDKFINAADVVDGEVLLARSNTKTIVYDADKRVWSPSVGYEKYPMGLVTWYGAYAFCEWAGGGCRLPTEAEWEFVSKAGSKQTATASNYGMGVTSVSDPTPVQITDANLGNYAWLGVNNTSETGDGYAPGIKPVGLKLPNVWGFYDMHGNVWEWCYDWSNNTVFTNAAVTDPINYNNPSGTPPERVLRGGSCSDAVIHCRSAVRVSNTPSFVVNRYGFRVVFPL